jgi:hypothetical protein
VDSQANNLSLLQLSHGRVNNALDGIRINHQLPMHDPVRDGEREANDLGFGFIPDSPLEGLNFLDMLGEAVRCGSDLASSLTTGLPQALFESILPGACDFGLKALLQLRNPNL